MDERSMKGFPHSRYHPHFQAQTLWVMRINDYQIGQSDPKRRDQVQSAYISGVLVSRFPPGPDGDLKFIAIDHIHRILFDPQDAVALTDLPADFDCLAAVTLPAFLCKVNYHRHRRWL